MCLQPPHRCNVTATHRPHTAATSPQHCSHATHTPACRPHTTLTPLQHRPVPLKPSPRLSYAPTPGSTQCVPTPPPPSRSPLHAAASPTPPPRRCTPPPRCPRTAARSTHAAPAPLPRSPHAAPAPLQALRWPCKRNRDEGRIAARCWPFLELQEKVLLLLLYKSNKTTTWTITCG